MSISFSWEKRLSNDRVVYLRKKHEREIRTIYHVNKNQQCEFIHILTAFYHLPISLVLFAHSLIHASEYAQVGLNYTLN